MADRPEGTISRHRRPDGSVGWRVRLWVDGRRVSYGVWETEAAAIDALAAALEQRGADTGGKTLRAWGVEWLDARERAGLRSVRKDRRRWSKHVAPSWLAALPLRKIDRPAIVRFVAELGELRHSRTGALLSRGTAVHTLNLVRKALLDAADRGAIPSNPATDVRIPRGRGSSAESWTWLTLDEIDVLLALPVSRGLQRSATGDETDTITPAQRAIYTVAIFAGLRAGEMWALRWRDVVLDERRPELVIRCSNDGPTKSGKVRHVPLLAPAREALETWRALAPGIGDALVFPGDDGDQHAEGFDAGWDRVRALLELDRRVRLHDLRHTCASHLVQGSWGRAWRLEEVREYLGHSSIRVSERYAHLAPGGLHDVARATTATTRRGHVGDTGVPASTIGNPRKGRG